MSPPAGPPLPFEFTVAGLPLSHQTRNKKGLAAWQQSVRTAAAAAWGGSPPLTVRLRIAVTYFHEGVAARMDDDNMVKPVRDALNQLVYADDALISDTQTRMASIDEPIRARHQSLALLRAFHAGVPFVHVIIDSAPSHVDPLR